MRRPVRPRLTVCTSAAAAVAAVRAVLAPAASAAPARTTLLPAHVSTTSSNAPDVVAHVPPFGRELG